MITERRLHFKLQITRNYKWESNFKLFRKIIYYATYLYNKHTCNIFTYLIIISNHYYLRSILSIFIVVFSNFPARQLNFFIGIRIIYMLL